MNSIHTFQSDSEFTDSIVHAIHSSIQRALKQKKSFRFALSGGSTPGPIYRRLAELDLPWDQIEIYLVDERFVPLHDENSNFRMIRETLLNHVSPKKIVYFDTQLPIEKALEGYASEFVNRQEKYFDLILLGIGPDGHTASLFPKSPALDERTSWVAHTTTDQFDVHHRLTLTYPALLSSKEIFFLLKGKGKKNILERILAGEDFPATKLFHQPTTQVFFLDERVEQ